MPPQGSSQRRVNTLLQHLLTPASTVAQEHPRTAKHLLPLLTNEELVGLVSGKDFWHNAGVPRYGIPPLRMTDGPFGARGVQDPNPASAATPCGVALGATWDVELLGHLGELLGEETKLKGAQILLGPTINLQRVPTGGRHFECFSEDPELTSQLAVAYIHGVQSRGVGACAKHFVANDQEDGRMLRSAELSPDTVEYYSRPFLAAVQEAGVVSIMTGYNKLNGTFCSENKWLLTDLLRGQWGFKGLVVSDWYGSHSLFPCLDGGLDLEMPGWPKMNWGSKLLKEVAEGRVPEELLRARAGNVLSVMERLGLLEPGLPQEPPPMQASENSPETQALLRKAAAESIVLMRNAAALPLAPGASIAVIGPSQLGVFGGGSSQVALNPSNRSLAEALRQRGASRVQELLGCDTVPYLPTMKWPLCSTPSGRAIEMEVFLGDGWLSGESLGKVEVDLEAETIRRGLSYSAKRNPKDRSKPGPWSARMTTTITAVEEGRYELGIAAVGQARVYAGDQLLIQIPTASGGGGAQPQSDDDFNPRFDEQRASLNLTAGEKIDVVIEWRPAEGGGGQSQLGASAARILLGCRHCPWNNDNDLAAPAVAAAKELDAAVVIVNSDEVTETEGRDARHMDLPANQLELIKRVAAVNPRTIVLLNTGGPRDVTPFFESTGAVLAIWFGGQEAADAVAAVLLDSTPMSNEDDAGYWGPCGRLPMSWPRVLADSVMAEGPSLRYPGDPEGTRVEYTDGTFVGYRWYETQKVPALLPFGYGLSYTSFQYGSNLMLSAVPAFIAAADGVPELSAGSNFAVHIDVQNTGSRPGKDVIQVYAVAADGSAPKQLVSFSKVKLLPGESKTAVLPIRFSVLAGTLGSVHARRSLPWEMKLLVGCSATNITGQKSFRVVALP